MKDCHSLLIAEVAVAMNYTSRDKPNHLGGKSGIEPRQSQMARLQPQVGRTRNVCVQALLKKTETSTAVLRILQLFGSGWPFGPIERSSIWDLDLSSCLNTVIAQEPVSVTVMTLTYASFSTLVKEITSTASALTLCESKREDLQGTY